MVREQKRGRTPHLLLRRYQRFGFLILSTVPFLQMNRRLSFMEAAPDSDRNAYCSETNSISPKVSL